MSVERRIAVPLSEYDLECLKDVVYDNENLKWVFKLDDVGDVEIEFISEENIEF